MMNGHRLSSLLLARLKARASFQHQQQQQWHGRGAKKRNTCVLFVFFLHCLAVSQAKIEQNETA